MSFVIEGTISYAGHVDVTAFDRDDPRHVIFSLAERKTNNGTIVIPDVDSNIHMSAYSGILTYATEETIFLDYYE